MERVPSVERASGLAAIPACRTSQAVSVNLRLLFYLFSPLSWGHKIKSCKVSTNPMSFWKIKWAEANGGAREEAKEALLVVG